MKRIKIYLFVIVTTLLFSCKSGYKQEYKTFDEFSKMNERNKGWFPKIIQEDATELRNISYLDSLCAFGKFSYKNSETYDSIFSSNQKIDFNLFIDKLNRNQKLIPNWFIDMKNIENLNIELIKQNGFYILNNKKVKLIYFILSN